MKNFVITVARGFGSGGRNIAAMLADKLGVHRYDKRILTLASQWRRREATHCGASWNGWMISRSRRRIT